MKQLVLCLFVLASCGDDDDPNGGDGVCADRPCRTTIASSADWAFVSEAHTGQRCDFAEETKYIAPASASAALQEIVFHDVKTHRLHLDFLTQVLPEYFGGLPPQMYQALVQRRATRQYWAGAIFQLRDVSGDVTGYGFDVIVDPTSPTEQLMESELEQIEAALETRFQLPLVYAPTTREAIDLAYSFARLTTHLPRACQLVECTDSTKDCIQIPEPVSLCGHFMEGRTVEVEHARKARLAAVPGTYELPREVGTHTVAPLFGAGELGPTHTAITPMPGTARYVVRDQGGYKTREYQQTFSAGTHTMALAWTVSLPDGGGGLQIAEPHVQGAVYATAALDGSTSYDDLVAFASCAATNLDAWRIRGAQGNGDGFTIDFRYAQPFAGSGPLLLTRGEVKLGGQTAVVEDYFRLVYAGEHHNWNNQYWVLFDSPVTYLGHPVYGLWIDEVAYQFDVEAAWTLGANLQPLDMLAVSTYSVEKLP